MIRAADALPEEQPAAAADPRLEEPPAAADALQEEEEPPVAADAPMEEQPPAVEEEQPAADAVAAVPSLGKFVPDPSKESRQQFLDRVRRAHKCKHAAVVEKVKAVPGLWELWPEDAPAPSVPQERPAAPPKRKAAQPQPQAAVAEPAPKRGRPGSNADLKDRLLAGGELESLEEYERVPALLRLAGQQRSRMVKAGDARAAELALDDSVKLYVAADRWADANGQPRLRRVQQQQANNDALFRAGLQIITAAHRCDNELLTAELQRQERRGE